LQFQDTKNPHLLSETCPPRLSTLGVDPICLYYLAPDNIKDIVDREI
jgi:hypothetical protein